MKKINLSIGIAAFNEESNIGWMLSSVLSQKEISFRIKEILIYSDGSTDKTVDVVKIFDDKRIKLVDSKVRLGKPSRLNQLFKKFTGDYLLLTDADVEFADELVIEKLVRKVIKNKQISLVMAKVFPFEGSTLLEKAAFNFFNARDSVRNGYDYTKTVYAARGAGMLLSKKFAKSLSLPSNILNDDAFIYLTARAKNLAIDFSRNAVILYKSVNNFKDYKNQFKRYLEGEKQFYNYFDFKLLEKEYRAPKKLLIKIMIKQIKTNFIAYAFLRLLNSYCQYTLNPKNKGAVVKWSIATSSKTIVINQIIEAADGKIV